MELSRMERETSYPPQLSSKAIRFMLGELAVYETADDAERVEMIITRLQYELKLREGQGA